jgi:thymidylate synthase
MINEPISVVRNNFQAAWLEAVRQLMDSHWELRNLVIHIKDPSAMDQTFHQKIESFSRAQSILGPKHVAYTIFPYKLYARKGNATDLFITYNKPSGLFDRIKTGWGTYFRRMTNYEEAGGIVNQLDNIISAIRDRDNISKAAYTVVIQKPGGETIRPLGGPCLNYIAFQVDAKKVNQPVTLGLLAVYRNHDFLERAYGNYWGLCNLLRFLSKEVGGIPGPLTCVSSHAYVSNKKVALKTLVEGFNETS